MAQADRATELDRLKIRLSHFLTSNVFMWIGFLLLGSGAPGLDDSIAPGRGDSLMWCGVGMSVILLGVAWGSTAKMLYVWREPPDEVPTLDGHMTRLGFLLFGASIVYGMARACGLSGVIDAIWPLLLVLGVAFALVGAVASVRGHFRDARRDESSKVETPVAPPL